MRLLLLSEDPVSLDELEAKLTQYLPAIRVIGKCYTWVDGVQAVQQLHPDTVVVDYDKWSIDPKKLELLKNNCKHLLAMTGDDVSKHRYGRIAIIDHYGNEEALLQYLILLLKL